MGSKKRAAWSKAKSEFLGAATGGDMSDLFAHEDERRDALDAERDEAWRYKSCERKTVTTRVPSRGSYGRLRKPRAAWFGLLQMRILRRMAPDVAPLEIGPASARRRRNAGHRTRATNAAAPKHRSERPCPQVDSSLNAGKQRPLHRPLDNDLARARRKRSFDQRLLIGARLLQMVQELELLFHRRALGAFGKHGIQIYTSGAASSPRPISSAVWRRPAMLSSPACKRMRDTAAASAGSSAARSRASLRSAAITQSCSYRST